jgi:LysR family hydrogen peroxide-inducible transcriptional activator
MIEDTKAEITDDGVRGVIRVAAIPTIAPYFLPNLLRTFATQYPAASLIVQEDTTEHLIRRCGQGEIDLAVIALPVPGKYLEVEELFDEELLLVLPLRHPLADRKKIVMEDIAQLPFVLLDEAHCLTESIVSFCRQRSFQPVAVERANQLAMVQELVSLSHGISMIPEMARRLDQTKRRVYRSLSGVKPTRKLAMVWNPYRFESRLVARFKDHLREFAKLSSAQRAGEVTRQS